VAKPGKITAVKKAGSSSKKARIRKLEKKDVGSSPADKPANDIFGFLAGKGTITITGDIVSPAFSPQGMGQSLSPSGSSAVKASGFLFPRESA
jgi:hypothetical protein